VYPQRLPDSPRIPGDDVKGTLEALIQFLGEFRKEYKSRASGSTCRVESAEDHYEPRTKWVTWIEEDGAQLVRSCGQLDDGQACVASRAVVIVHRDVERSTFQAGDCGVHPEALALVGTPGNLQGISGGVTGQVCEEETHRYIASRCECGCGDQTFCQ